MATVYFSSPIMPRNVKIEPIVGKRTTLLGVAKEHDIPIRKDADLVEVLQKLEIDEEIPLEIFAVVAEIFAYIYKTNKQKY